MQGPPRLGDTGGASFGTADTRGVQESEQEPESSKFFRSLIGLGVKFNIKTGVGVGAGVTISLTTIRLL